MRDLEEALHRLIDHPGFESLSMRRGAPPDHRVECAVRIIPPEDERSHLFRRDGTTVTEAVNATLDHVLAEEGQSDKK